MKECPFKIYYKYSIMKLYNQNYFSKKFLRNNPIKQALKFLSYRYIIIINYRKLIYKLYIIIT